MANVRPIVLVENGELSTIRDDTGLEVTFDTLEHLSNVTGIDFTGKFYIGYEPTIDYFEDSEDPSMVPGLIPYAPYEALIADVATLLANSLIPGYGLPEVEAKPIAEEDALRRLAEYYDQEILSQDTLGEPNNGKKWSAKVNKSMRKEAKGTETAGDIQRLDDNDTLDDWYDAVEIDMETQGETWIEDPIRTSVELNAFDPATSIVWTPYPL